ncbi:MAG TPA: hypothetical protein VF132_11525 [Rudaea sp.]
MRTARQAVSIGLIGVTLAAHSAAFAAGAALAGDYVAVGKNPNGTPYKGAVHIEQRGDIYQVRWDAGGVTKGTGVVRDSKFIVGYGAQACGVVAYRYQPDGVLEGLWALPNSTHLGSESATPAKAGTVAGDYLVAGENTDGTRYKGALFVHETKDGDLAFQWRVGTDSFGLGFRDGPLIAAALGGASCSVVVYTLGSDGTLAGQWRPPEGGRGTKNARRAE